MMINDVEELKKMFVGRIRDDSVLQLKIGDKL
jgi:hypothetical protein